LSFPVILSFAQLKFSTILSEAKDKIVENFSRIY